MGKSKGGNGGVIINVGSVSGKLCGFQYLNPFLVYVPMLYLLKTTEKGFLFFQGYKMKEMG